MNLAPQPAVTVGTRTDYFNVKPGWKKLLPSTEYSVEGESQSASNGREKPNAQQKPFSSDPTATTLHDAQPRILICDHADEFRIRIVGKFAEASVWKIRQTWMERLAECFSRRLTIDISDLSDFDTAGLHLLRDMYKQGTRFAARTPRSLTFLIEVSKGRRRDY